MIFTYNELLLRYKSAYQIEGFDIIIYQFFNNSLKKFLNKFH